MHSGALANQTIIITRPVDQAKKLSRLITEAGGIPILFPLIAIAPLNNYDAFDAVVQNIDTYDWAIFISSNAVEHGMPRLPPSTAIKHLKFAAIGPVTAQTLKQFNVHDVLIPKDRFDSESLLLMPEMQSVDGKKVMIVRGIGGRDVLADTLKSRGAAVSFAECYQRINPQSSCEALSTLWAADQLDGIVVTSSEAMRYLLDLANNTTWLSQVTLYVNHARIAELPLSMGLHVNIAHAPGDEAMMELICNVSARPF